MTELGICEACKAEILWSKTEKGKSIPLDLESTPNGNIYFNERGVAMFKSKVNDPGARPLYVSHFATCPEAARFRKP